MVELSRLTAGDDWPAKTLNNISEGVVVVDASCWEIIFTSRKFELMFGYAEGEMLGLPISIVNAPTEVSPEATANAIVQQLEETGEWYGEVTNIKKDGTVFWCSASVTSFEHESLGTLWVTVQKDITERKRLELEREIASSRLEKIADQVPGVVYQYRLRPDGSSCFPYASEKIREIYWVEPKEVEKDASKVFEVLHPDDYDGVVASIQKSAQKLTPWDHEYRVKFEDGTVRWLLGQSIPQQEEDGSVLWHGFITDITEHKHSEQHHKSLLENLTSGFVVHNAADTSIRFANAKACKLLGLTNEQMLGKKDEDPVWDFVDENGGKLAPEGFPVNRVITTGKTVKNQVVGIVRGDPPETVWVLCTAYPIYGHEDTLETINVIVTDVTERKEAEAELSLYRTHLEDLVDLRTRELSEARGQAEAANIAKSAFLANMSHEIRTPMNAVIGLTHLMQTADPTPEQLKQLGRIDSAASHLLEVINNILDLSKIEAGKLKLEQSPFSLSEVLSDVESLLKVRAEAKGLSLNIETVTGADQFTGDATRIRQCLFNYLGNAIKFTRQGSITVRTRQLDKSETGLTLRFEVEDTGIGIPEDKLNRIFQSFEQEDVSTTREFGGTGLGLNITRRLARLMRGDCGVESEVGKGSVFWFSAHVGLASPYEAVLPEKKRGPSSQDCKGTRVLLVEDNEINREVAKAVLERFEVITEVAKDGQEALEKVSGNTYDLILMDVQMPIMDGHEATRVIRAMQGRMKDSGPRFRDIPILAMTANAYEEDRQACLASGMNDFIAKPVSPDKLYEMISKWVSSGRVNDF